jgi:hypothetical protein
MKKTSRSSGGDDMRAEYDFSGVPGVRGKYAERCKVQAGCYLVSVDLGLRRFFPDDEAVNTALRMVAEAAQRAAKSAPRRKSA